MASTVGGTPWRGWDGESMKFGVRNYSPGLWPPPLRGGMRLRIVVRNEGFPTVKARVKALERSKGFPTR